MGGYAPASITSYVCALSYIHMLKSLPDPAVTFLVQKVLVALTKIRPTVDSRLPITIDILRILIQAIPSGIQCDYIRALVKTMCLVAFYGLMRFGQITVDRTEGSVILLKQIHSHTGHFPITIHKFKHNTNLPFFELLFTVQPDSQLCLVSAISHYLSLRGRLPGPLFCFPSLQPINHTQTQFTIFVLWTQQTAL